MGQPPELTSPPAHSLPEADKHPAPLPPSQRQLLRPCPVTECQAVSHSPCGSGVQTRRPWHGLVSVQLKWPNLVATGRKLPLWLEVRAGGDTLEGTREGDWVPAAGISLEFRTLTLSSKYTGSKCWGGHVCAPSIGLHRSHQPVHGEEPLSAGAGSVLLTAGPQCLAQAELGTDYCFSVGRISEMAKLYVKREGSCCGPLRTSSPGAEGDTMEDQSQARAERRQWGASGLVVKLAPGCAFPTSVLGHLCLVLCSLATKSLSPKELSVSSLSGE